MSDKTVEVISGRERRRRWSAEDKLRIVATTYEPGACVKQVAASHDVSPGLLFTWRRQVRDGRLALSTPPLFLPVRAMPAAIPEPREAVNGRSAGQIEIELKDGSRVRVAADASLASLRRVIAALRG
jgi:transposase